MVRQRLDTKQAAEALGITPDAVRKRASRGLLESEKAQDGKLYIWLDNDTPTAGHAGQDGSDRDILIEFLRSELALWQEEARRKDHIIAALTERIPELEAPRAARESDLTATESDESSAMPQNQQEPKSEPERRSWWRRLFDLPT
jgi:hypothetical protein